MVGPIDSVIGWLMIGQKIDWQIDRLYWLTYLIERLYWNNLAPAVRRSYNTIHWINLYPVDNANVLLSRIRWIAICWIMLSVSPLYKWALRIIYK